MIIVSTKKIYNRLEGKLNISEVLFVFIYCSNDVRWGFVGCWLWLFEAEIVVGSVFSFPSFHCL